MTLRMKTLIILSVTIFSLILILYVTSQVLFLNSFVALEKQLVAQKVDQVLGTLSAETHDWGILADGWAAWDDTYEFVAHPSEAYIQANLPDESFVSMGLNLILFFDADGELVYGKSFDLETHEETPIPRSLQEHLKKGGVLLRHDHPESRVTGVLSLIPSPMIVASRPILTSEREGPIRGTLIIGRYLNDAEIDRLAQAMRLSLSIQQVKRELPLPPDFQAAWASLSPETPVSVQVQSSEVIAGYALVKDVYGDSALILKVGSPREIYRQGQIQTVYLMSALLGVSLVFGLMTLGLLERVVISPVARLNADVSQIGASGDPSARLSVVGSDELASLAASINDMLVALEQSQRNLRQSEERYRLLFNSGSDMIFVGGLTADNRPDRLIEVNDVACQRLGYTRAELLDMFVLDLTASEDWDDFPVLAHDLVTQGQSLFEMAIVARDGAKIPVELNAHLFNFGQHPAVLAVARDITERKQAEEALKRRNRELTMLYEATAVISSNLSLNVVLQTVAEQMTLALNSSGCALSLWRSDKNVVETVVDYNKAWPDETEPPGTVYQLADYPITRRVLEQGEYALIQHDDPQADEAELALLREWEAFTLLILPLVIRDRVMGLVELIDDVHPRAYTPDEVRLAESLAAQAAVAIENARLYEQAQQEIAERKRAERELRDSEERFRSLVESMDDIVFTLDHQQRHTGVFGHWIERSGMSPEMFLGKKAPEIVDPESAQLHEAANRQALEGKNVVYEWAAGGPDGIKYFQTSLSPLIAPDGTVAGIVGVGRDITVLKRMEQALRESERRFRDVARTAGDWIWEVDAESRYIYSSPVVEQILGYKPEEMEGRPLYDTLSAENRDELWQASRQFRGQQESFLRLVSEHLHKDGHIVVLETSGLPMVDGEGNLAGYRGVHRDVTAQQRLEERLSAVYTLGQELVLARNEQAVAQVAVDAARLLLQCHLCGLWLVDEEGVNLVRRAVWATETPASLHQLALADKRGITTTVVRTGEAIYLPDVRVDSRYIDTELASLTALCVPLQVEDRIIGAINVESRREDAFDSEDQRIFFTLATQVSIAIENARLYQAVAQQRERLRALSARLAEAEETERKRLARELHDQIGQNLTALGINLNILQSQIPDDLTDVVGGRLSDSLALVKQTTQRVRNVMSDLLPPVLEDYGLVSALRWYGAQFASRVGLDVVVGAEETERRLPAPIESVLFRITQEALTNVAKHAQATQAVITVEMEDGGARLTITDDGVGFDPSLVSAPGDRHGWGLLSMAERAEAMGGSFHIQSGLGKGTQIVVEVMV